MTRPLNRADPTVPIGSAIVAALKAAGPQSANTLARRLKLRKANVLVVCRALAAADQIRRMGNRWALRPPVRCAGINEAGTRCARVAASGRAFCHHHDPKDAPQPRPEPVVADRTILPPTAPTNVSAVVASPLPPLEPAPASSPASDAAPELFVNGRRVTEADVIEALSMLGDEEVQTYREGRRPKSEAYRIAYRRLRSLARM